MRFTGTFLFWGKKYAEEWDDKNINYNPAGDYIHSVSDMELRFTCE